MSFRNDAALKVRERNDVFLKTTETEQRVCTIRPLLMTDDGRFVMFSATEL